MTTPLRLLLIEDSEDDAELIGLELQRAGYEVDCLRVDTEDRFLNALDGNGWELVICDFQMPQFDGLTAFSLFQKRDLDIPFIFVSGALGEDRAVEAMRAGAKDYLLKGNLARLSVAVRRELQEALNRRRQRLAEETTRREQRRLAMAVEASGAGIFEHSVPLEAETYLSERWAEILGFAREELPFDESFVDWIRSRFHPDDGAILEGNYADFVHGRTATCAVEGRVRHKSGQWIDIAVFAKAVERDANRRATDVVGVVLDLRERKRLESQLRQAQKMEAVGRLAGGIAHDFNNLLTAILSFGEFVLNELRAGDAVHRDMQEVLKAARRAESLTGQLLAFSRRKTVAPRVLNLNEIVSDMERMLTRLLGEDVEVLVKLSPELGNVRVDPSAFEQVMVNLSVNARDAMPEGGKLTIETENADVDEDFVRAHGGVPAGRYVVIAVSDDGMGMDEPTQRRLFEPFFTTKDAGHGTGLGLATCYGIVKQAGGYIGVESEPGQGTTFRIYLPRVSAEPELVTKLVVARSLNGTERVLVIEDEEQVRRLVVRILTRFGYSVLEASNGEEALVLCERPGRVDLLLSDVVIPGMSGKSLTDRLAQLQPQMKVLYMSGYTPNAVVHRGVLEGNRRLLQKPFTPESLAQAVRQVLDGRP